MKSLPVEKYKRQALKPRRVSWNLTCKQAETGPLTRSMDKQFEKLFAMMAEMKAGQEGLERKMEAGQEEMRVAQAGLEQKMEAGQEEMRVAQAG
ncbi:hypothetical protein AVEN_52086-1 [Araneus ventricosus]|uniref:Uncharacterized protein n=1 Tax=Araneus ventricosus TaxID=182803 RepID=A0A4Y2UG86_ARAVE|nr:hypothetical protein AVEN_52086-1 [Araneus ventricosus]